MANSLAHETSPYLLQHQDNPVDWMAYSEAAFGRARGEDKPILLSIGYSACHWCHVMAHESFEDAETAALMNQLFVCIKVDREEMPDVDQVYQHALQLQGEHGGWPLTMFLLPDGKPYYGGTYFPPHDAYGRPGFKRILMALGDAYHQRRAAMQAQAERFVDGLRQIGKSDSSISKTLELGMVESSGRQLAAQIDRSHGGFRRAPKFPSVPSLSLILRAARRAAKSGRPEPVLRLRASRSAQHERELQPLVPNPSKDAQDERSELAEVVLLTLRKMAAGGIYDQIGGGFARYSTDEVWLVPHFEKMLYDNAQLLKLYAEAYQWSKDPTFKRVILETAAYIERDLRSPEGGLYTAQDADSEGVEGKYYVWAIEEIEALVGRPAADVVARCYGVRPEGNWHDPHGHGAGGSILHVTDSPRDEREQQLFDQARAELLAAREKRVPPLTDDKILASVNGLAISGLAEAGRILGDAALIAAAERTADFVLSCMVAPDGRLVRTYKNGIAKLPGTLDDHAFVAGGLIALYEATGKARYFDQAMRLTTLSLQLFYDGEAPAFYLTAESDPLLIERPRSKYDAAIPSGVGVCLSNLIRLGDATANQNWLEIAALVLQSHVSVMRENPFGLSSLLSALDLMVERPTEIVLAGDNLSAFERTIADIYLPNRIIVYAKSAPSSLRPLLDGKEVTGKTATAFVCRNFACETPLTETSKLTAILS